MTAVSALAWQPAHLKNITARTCAPARTALTSRAGKRGKTS